jgi:hypothetical protein
MEGYQPLLVVLVAIVMGWFGGGVIWNLRRGNAVLKWMQAGLPMLGEKTTLRWLGSSAVELVIAKARSPFRRCELVLVMEPRDVPWFWLLSRFRGRRDMLIFRGQLNSAPRLEYEVLAPESWTGRSAASRAALAQWGDEALGGYHFVAPKASLPVSRTNASNLLESAHKVHPKIWRLAVRREFPQLELHIPMPNPKTCDAGQFFQSVRSLAQGVSGSSEAVAGDR